MDKFAHIIGWGSYLPERVLTNDDIAKTVNTSDEWIYTRTGIKQRHIAEARESTATLAYEAASRALTVAGLTASQIDLIIVATSTPSHMFPSTACKLQDDLGAARAGAFDLSAACSGFVYALTMASQSIQSGAINTAVVVGAETMSRVLDWTDRGTCIFFGDGAGAVVLQGSSVPGGIMSSTLRSDGSGGELLSLPNLYRPPAPVSGMEPFLNGHRHNVIQMNGRQVFRFATRVIVDSIEDVLEKAGLTVDDVALFVPHQANVRIIEAAAKKLKVAADKFYVNVEMTGNTSAASIPIALCEAVEKGMLKPNDNVVFVGFGGGLTWAASVAKWDVTPPEITRVDQQLRRVRFILARVRSRLRRIGRWFTGLGRSPTPEARLRDARKK